MEKKKFLISIDTEGDNLWRWKAGQPILTNNAKYLGRFQDLCNQYGFKPTYLTNYEMATCKDFVAFAKHSLALNECEIGMHLHAWNTPPLYELIDRIDGKKVGHPYLIEYPTDIMEKKISFMTELLKRTFGVVPITHRAGRWAIDNRYLHLLDKYGYKVDCSVTPGISWEKSMGQTTGSKGVDYTKYSYEPYKIKGTGLIEVPVTVRNNHRIIEPDNKSFRSFVGKYYKATKGRGKIWLRPNGRNIEDLLYIVHKTYSSKSEYLMFMLHSSELMPGGSEVFSSNQKIEKLYEDLVILFEEVYTLYEGMTIGDFSKYIGRIL